MKPAAGQTADAAAAVEDWEGYTKDLVSIHTNLADAIDWRQIAYSPKPEKSVLGRAHEERASEALKNFKPSILDRFRGGPEKRRQRYEADIAEAIELDRATYEAATRNYHSALGEWENECGLAVRLIGEEATAIKEVIEEFQSLTDDDRIGSAVEFSISDGFMHAMPKVHSDSIVPNFRRKQLASGRLSETKMPVGQFNELCQDYVASVALKVAGDLFHILPLEEIYVTCMSLMVNSQTGQQEHSPILSVQFVRETMNRLNVASRPPEERITAANTAAKVEPSQGGYVNAIQVYPYSEGALYQLYAAPEQVSDIALQQGEKIVAVSAGDTLRWVVGDAVSGSGKSARAHVLVKPTKDDLKTNLVIITDRRTYHLELTSNPETYMASVSWRYPRDELIALQGRNQEAESAAELVVDTRLRVDNLRFRYKITGDDPPWRPVRVFDDTKKVYIQFPARLDQGDAPPLFVVGPDGRNQLVNYRVKGNYYIVDRMFAAAELRLGEDPQQVVRITRTDRRVSKRRGVFNIGSRNWFEARGGR